MKNTVVRKSDVDGRGLFAFRSLVEGQVVEVLDAEYLLQSSRSKYAVRFGSRWVMLHGKCKYINQSNSPNVQLTRTGVFALRDISAGEELFCLYESVL